MTLRGRQITWGELLTVAVAFAAVALWSWGAGFYMGRAFEQLDIMLRAGVRCRNIVVP
jgi:hypothetical protein